MLDYEIEKYTVEYHRKNAVGWSTTSFGTEKEAIDFIKESRSRWSEYKLTKISNAIIDF